MNIVWWLLVLILVRINMLPEKVHKHVKEILILAIFLDVALVVLVTIPVFVRFRVISATKNQSKK